MDYFDLWGPPYDLGVEDDECYMPNGLECEFYFDCRSDVIEENAKNERSCVQVLRILIKNADAEIDELERDMVFLQNELAWVECDDWPDICCTALREKINWLDKSLGALRSNNVEDSETQLLINQGPVERLDKFIRVLLKSYNRIKDTAEQMHDVVVTNLPSGSAQCGTEHLDRNAKLCDFPDAENIKVRDHRHVAADCDMGLELREKMRKDMETPAGPGNVSTTEALKEPTNNNQKENFSAASETRIERVEGRDNSSLLKPTRTLAPDPAADANQQLIRQQLDTQLGRSNLKSSCFAKFREYCLTDADKWEKGKVPDMKQKLRDLVAKAKQRLEENKSAPTGNMDSFLKQDKREHPSEIASFRDILAVTEHSAINSLLGQQDKQKESLDKEQQRLQPDEVDMAGSTAANDELISNLFEEPSSQKPKSNPESNLVSTQRLGPVSKEKRQLESCDGEAGLNEPLNRKIRKKTSQQRQSEARKISSQMDDGQVSAQKSKTSSVLPAVKEPGDSIIGESPNSVTTVDLCTVDPTTEVMASSHPAIDDLKELKLRDLHAIAKAQKLTHYYKLKKNDLVERLRNQLGPS